MRPSTPLTTRRRRSWSDWPEPKPCGPSVTASAPTRPLAEADRHADLLDMDPQPWQAAFRLVACGDGCRSPADVAT